MELLKKGQVSKGHKHTPLDTPIENLFINPGRYESITLTQGGFDGVRVVLNFAGVKPLPESRIKDPNITTLASLEEVLKQSLTLTYNQKPVAYKGLIRNLDEITGKKTDFMLFAIDFMYL